MKAGLATSVILHAALIGLGLFTLSAPRAFDVADVEALPIDIVPLSDLPQVQEGDKKAPLAEKSAPKPTQKPDIVANAQKVGENDIDTENPVTPEAKPKPIKTAEATAPAPTPVEKPKLEEVQKSKEEPKPVPATELAPVPEPKQEVKPEPVKQEEPKPEPLKQADSKPAELSPEQVAAIEPTKPDAIAETLAEEKETLVEETVQLPNAAPTPAARPRPAEAQTAKAPERKASEKPVKEASSKPKSEDTGSLEEQVAALLNKEKASGGGAKRSTQTAALGGKKTTGAKLSSSEEAALRDQLSGCWSIPAGIEEGAGLRVTVEFNLDATGKLDGRPSVTSSSGNPVFDQSAVRAVQKCDQQGLMLPQDKAEIWSEVVVNFDPSEMF